MSDEKWTPGPCRVLHGGTKWDIATVEDDDVVAHVPLREDGREEEWARLIAAAPEMVDLLEDMSNSFGWNEKRSALFARIRGES